MSISKNELLIYKKLVKLGQQVNGNLDQTFTHAVNDLKEYARNSGESFSQVVRVFNRS
jgi:hypothetical protein